jgi:hypothetical protein
MVTIIKIKNIKDTSWVIDMERMFEDTHGFNFTDCMLVSDCDKYEYLYLFMNDFEIQTFLNLLVEFKVEVLSRTDFTEEMIDVLMNNDIDKFKENFNGMTYLEEVIENFGFQNIDKDMILDKISKHGIKSLSDFDYKILKY